MVLALMGRSGGTSPVRVLGGRRGAAALGSSSCVSLHGFWRISCFPYVVHTWKFGALFRRGLVSGSLVSGVWVLLVKFRYWIFREMLPLFGAPLLGSTVNTCSASVRDAF